MEKIAYQIIEKTEKIEESEEKTELDKIVVNKENLIKYLGHKVFEDGQIYDRLVPGVIKGLAYSGYGGSVLFLEVTPSSNKSDKANLKITGSLGDVMQESMKIAYIYARNFLKENNNSYLEGSNIHIHVPEGATPKDGPSAGIAITSALISLSLNRSINDNIGMTGEISLKGKVMKIGGLKEKIIAA